MRAKEFLEGMFGTSPKRPPRPGSRPERGHESEPRYKNVDMRQVKLQIQSDAHDMGDDFGQEVETIKILAKSYNLNPGLVRDMLRSDMLEPMDVGDELDEEGKASRKLCLSAKPDDELGASQLASCKSQGLRARDGEKSHKLGKSPKSRVKVGGHKIKGHKYGGPLPDWS